MGVGSGAVNNLKRCGKLSIDASSNTVCHSGSVGECKEKKSRPNVNVVSDHTYDVPPLVFNEEFLDFLVGWCHKNEDFTGVEVTEGGSHHQFLVKVCMFGSQEVTGFGFEVFKGGYDD